MAYRLGIVLLGISVLLGGAASAQNSGGPDGTASFFSQGQTAYNPDNLARSREEALQDLYEQAVTQAIGTLMEPSKMGSNYAAIQSSILSRSGSYVQNYQVFAESTEGGIYRVRGQVAVAVDALAGDLQQLGLLGQEVAAPGGGGRPAGDGSRTMSVELPVFKQKVLWAVVEKWNAGWTLPQGDRGDGGYLAPSVLQESQDYDWALVFPEQGSIPVDGRGSVPLPGAVSAGKAQGARAVVMGTAALQRGENNESRLQASIRVLDVNTGQVQGEIHQEWKIIQDGTFHEGAMELAAIVAPQLDRLLRQASYTPDGGGTTGRPSSPVRVSIGNTESVALVVHSYGHYSNWEQMESVLRNTFAAFRVKTLEVGPREIKAHLEGVDSQLPGHLEGIRLRNGLQVQVRGYSPESKTLEVALVSGGASQAE